MSIWSGRYSRQPHGFWELDQVLEAGRDAAAFLLQMSDFCDRNQTDSRVTSRQLATLLNPRSVRKHTAKLVEARLISVDETGEIFTIEGWLDGHKSREEIAEQSHNRRSAGRKGGKASGKARSKPDDESKQVASGLLPPVQYRTEQNSTEQPPPQPRGLPETPAAPAGSGGGGDDVELLPVGRIAHRLGALEGPPAEAVRIAYADALDRGWMPSQLRALANTALTKGDPTAWWLATAARADPYEHDTGEVLR